MNINLRALAAFALSDVLNKGRSLSDVLPLAQQELGDARDQALLQEIVYGCLRHRRRLLALRDQLLQKPLKDAHSPAGLLLLVGLYQLLYLRVPPHAAISETVNACDDIDEPRARGLINAVLRRAQREAAQIMPVLDEKLAVQFSHPDWMLARWHTHTDLPALLAANNAPAPMCLRIDRRLSSREAYQQQLKTLAVNSTAHAIAEDALLLENASDITRLPGFSEGMVSVQDAAAQLAADYLLLQPELRVLDACCAPGGKTVHMLERVPTLHVTALDNDATRMQRVEENLQRARASARLIVADAMDTKNWWDGSPYDRILCDAPCSATGVIRRHPDIKWLRRDRDIAQLAKTQLQLLQQLWPLLKRGGYLLYATCSTFTAENDEVINAFLGATADAELDALNDQHKTLQIWPGEQQMDGFFYARLRKK